MQEDHRSGSNLAMALSALKRHGEALHEPRRALWDRAGPRQHAQQSQQRAAGAEAPGGSFITAFDAVLGEKAPPPSAGPPSIAATRSVIFEPLPREALADYDAALSAGARDIRWRCTTAARYALRAAGPRGGGARGLRPGGGRRRPATSTPGSTAGWPRWSAPTPPPGGGCRSHGQLRRRCRPTSPTPISTRRRRCWLPRR